MSFHVLDQNYLRSSELRSFLANLPRGEYVLLPDEALLEMLKGEEWHQTALKSLEILKDYPSRVLIGYARSELLKHEIQTKTPVDGIVADDITGAFQTYLTQYSKSGNLDSFANDVIGKLTTAQEELKDHQLNVEENAGLFRTMHRAIRESLSPEAVKALRRDPANLPCDLLGYSIVHALSSCRDALLAEGLSFDDAKALLSKDTFLLRHMLGYSLTSLRWIGSGGLEPMKDESINNQLIDIDYAVAASYGISILTKEGRVQQLYHDIKDALSIAIKPEN
jgi:hypothetical protein